MEYTTTNNLFIYMSDNLFGAGFLLGTSMFLIQAWKNIQSKETSIKSMISYGVLACLNFNGILYFSRHHDFYATIGSVLQTVSLFINVGVIIWARSNKERQVIERNSDMAFIFDLDGTLFDIGARDTKLAAIVKNEGFSKITLIDKNELIDGNTSEFEFIQTDLETFQPEIKYDIIVCRHVLSFTEHPLKNLEKILSFGTTTYFTLFGIEDARKKLHLVTKDQIEKVLSKFSDLEIRYQSESKFKGRLYNGDIIDWHLFTYITKKTS